MDQVSFVAALWLLLALVSVLIANWLRISTARGTCFRRRSTN